MFGIRFIFKFKLYLINDILTKVSTFNPAAQIEPYLSVLYLYTIMMLLALYMTGVFKEKYGVFAGIDEVVKITKGIFLVALYVLII